MSKFLSAVRQTLTRRMSSLPSSVPSILVTRKTEPEPLNRYKPGGYHPVKVGELYNERYQVVRQLGWGLHSTVWLVKDVRDQHLAAMKVLVGDLTNEKGGWDERGIHQILNESRYVCQVLDDFTHRGPNGNHICLVLEPMGLTVFDLYRSSRGALPLPLVKRITKHILRALRYIHEHGVIHTDIKGDNILITGMPPEMDQANIQLGYDHLMSSTFKLTDFGAANRASNCFASIIQPEKLRSPEVIIGAKWDTKTDIYNFGCLVYEFSRGAALFDPHWKNEESGMNPYQTHLSQMSGLLGEFPLKFLEKGANSSRYFDDKGCLLIGSGRYSIRLEDLLLRGGHSVEETRKLAAFLSLMLTINPEDRWSAAQLLDHPWLRTVE